MPWPPYPGPFEGLSPPAVQWSASQGEGVLLAVSGEVDGEVEMSGGCDGV